MVGRRARLPLLLLLGACSSSSKPRVVEDARHAPQLGDARAGDVASADAALPAPVANAGDVQIRVEWPDVPSTVRASPGKTACGTPRAPAVAPSTTWGIGDVLVIVEGAPAVTTPTDVRFADCAFTPRLAVGGSLALSTTADRPLAVSIARRRLTTALAQRVTDPARTAQLPIAGHEVTVALAPGDVYELAIDRAADRKDVDPAWVVGGAGAVTDGSGVVLVKDVPAGTRAVHAWLPPRGGQPERFATGEVTVVAGDLAELTLVLAR